jgi:CubicO group peptidase (beta-lactamase class C family)
MFRTVSGTADLTTGRPAQTDDWWDLASLTKVLVTLPEVLDLVDRGALDLDQPLADAWPRSAGYPVAEATIQQLLSYDAGTPGIVDFFRTIAGAAQIVEAALATPLARPVGSGAVYSDIGFILLGQLVVDHTGRSLAELAVARTGLRYGPVPGAAVATEHCRWRNRLIIGEVHDENTAAMGGVAGHAGAFGTLDLVTAAARDWLAERVVSRSLHAKARQCWSVNDRGEEFGLGWLLTPRSGVGGPTGSPHGYGCAGFVGNRIWLEPSFGYGVVILTNRIHPNRTDAEPFRRWCDRLFAVVAGTFQQTV